MTRYIFAWEDENGVNMTGVTAASFSKAKAKALRKIMGAGRWTWDDVAPYGGWESVTWEIEKRGRKNSKKMEMLRNRAEEL